MAVVFLDRRANDGHSSANALDWLLALVPGPYFGRLWNRMAAVKQEHCQPSFRKEIGTPRRRPCTTFKELAVLQIRMGYVTQFTHRSMKGFVRYIPRVVSPNKSLFDPICVEFRRAPIRAFQLRHMWALTLGHNSTWGVRSGY
jgi:hypothetical protein